MRGGWLAKYCTEFWEWIVVDSVGIGWVNLVDTEFCYLA